MTHQLPSFGPPWPAVLACSGIQSPLSFGGFGALTRHLGRLSGAISEALEVDALDKGSLGWINAYNLTPVEMPFGGYKQSGIGRENALEALGHYSQVKSVYVETGDVASPY